MFYFVRHGKTDYSQKNTKIYQGWGTQLAPLSEKGIAQIEKAALDERLRGADVILTSPYTRAVQTAAILSRVTGAKIVVETDLHEWMANSAYIYDDDETAGRSFAEYVAMGGAYPAGEKRRWEDENAIRARVLPVLEKYRKYGKVIIASHGMLIKAVTGKPDDGRQWVDNGEIAEFVWSASRDS